MGGLKKKKFFWKLEKQESADLLAWIYWEGW